jgi:hypothetical protein
MSDNIMQQHPITPPPELMEQWMQVHTTKYDLARRAAQWGADQELEACCEVLRLLRDRVEIVTLDNVLNHLRAARRPKPPSLKEQALQALNDAVKMADDAPPEGICSYQAYIIRRALEHLPD